MTYGAVSIFGVSPKATPCFRPGSSWRARARHLGAKLLACGCGAILYLADARKTLAASASSTSWRHWPMLQTLAVVQS